jgi:hypothetical protein
MISAAFRGAALKAFFALSVVTLLSAGDAAGQESPPNPLADRARASIIAAGRVFADELGLEGSYVYEYSRDRKSRRAEGSVDATTGWVEPPGTPAVGAAFLRLYELTGDPSWLDAARKVGGALLRTQLLSGGWHDAMEFDPDKRRSWCYRADGVTPDGCEAIKDNRGKNRTVLDDDATQSAIRFLIWLDRTLQGKDKPAHEALVFALNSLLAAQYPNGAWPVFIETKRRAVDVPVTTASLPGEWPRIWVKPSGGPYYILNDNLVRDTVHVLLLAERHFNDRAYLDAAIRGGDFLLKAQLPEPQRGWAQTYDGAMHPVWGRPFEPPAVASMESAGAVSTLLELYGRTGDGSFLEAAKSAGGWILSVRGRDQNWARFYELGANRPIYVDAKEMLTYSPFNLREGYAFRGRWDIPQVLDQLAAAEQGEPVSEPPFWPSAADSYRSKSELEAAVRAIVGNRDGSGWWVERGWIRSESFIDAVFIVARYLSSAN